MTAAPDDRTAAHAVDRSVAMRSDDELPTIERYVDAHDRSLS